MHKTESTVHTRGALVSEWARLLWTGTGDAVAARQIYKQNEQLYLDSRAFWINWLDFELQQPTSEADEEARHQQIRSVFTDIRQYSRLPAELIKELSVRYFAYLRERGGKDAMKEYMQLDQEINGPHSTFTGVPTAPPVSGTAVEESKRSKKRRKLNGNASTDSGKAVSQHAANAISKDNTQPGGQSVNGS